MRIRARAAAAAAVFLALALGGMTSTSDATAPKIQPLLNGADISWLPSIEQSGSTFRDAQGKVADPLSLMHDSGLKVARVRLWVNPPTQHGSLAEVLVLAKRIKGAGLQFVLDLHYSDWWADPGKQNKPAAWANLSQANLEKQVTTYTKATVAAFVAAKVAPDWVQVGNEVTNGLLWPTGSFANPAEMVKLLNLGMSAVKAASPSTKLLIHLDTGGDAQHTDSWLRTAFSYKLRKPDALGLSYYAQWHGPLIGLASSVIMVTQTYKMKMFIAETAYPNSDQIDPTGRGNTFASLVLNPGESRLSSYPLNQMGQAMYAASLNAIMRAAPSGRGLGVWWWEGFSPNLAQLNPTFDAAGIWNSSLVDVTGKPNLAMAELGR